MSKSLYPFSYLNHIGFEDISAPAQRYLYKFENQRKEICHLKHHEKDFLFSLLNTFYIIKGEKEYDLFRIPEAKEYLFERIILTHAKGTMVFDGPVTGPYGLLTPKEKRKNKRFFYEYLSCWKEQVQSGKGVFLSVIKNEIIRKITAWEKSKNERQMEYDRNMEAFVYALFFHIYYHIRLFFEDLSNPFYLFRINDFDVVFNVYSFVHILSRHYYPDLHFENDVSLNAEMDCINLDFLPEEIMRLVVSSNHITPITPSTEYLLFQHKHTPYILWVKYKRLNETRGLGFEIRSFYKCTAARDLERFKNGVYYTIE